MARSALLAVLLMSLLGVSSAVTAADCKKPVTVSNSCSDKPPYQSDGKYHCGCAA